MADQQCSDSSVTALRTALKHGSTGAVWLAFVLIAMLYFFGLAASSAIPFGNPPMSIPSVVQQVSNSDLSIGDVFSPFHCAVLATSFATVLVYILSRSRRVRVTVPLFCLFAPLFWMFPAGGIKGIAQWLLAVPAAPLFTISALAGGQDGEFYSEGFVVFTAIGWWLILWCVLLFAALRLPKHETQGPRDIAEPLASNAIAKNNRGIDDNPYASSTAESN